MLIARRSGGVLGLDQRFKPVRVLLEIADVVAAEFGQPLTGTQGLAQRFGIATRVIGIGADGLARLAAALVQLGGLPGGLAPGLQWQSAVIGHGRVNRSGGFMLAALLVNRSQFAARFRGQFVIRFAPQDLFQHRFGSGQIVDAQQHSGGIKI